MNFQFFTFSDFSATLILFSSRARSRISLSVHISRQETGENHISRQETSYFEVGDFREIIFPGRRLGGISILLELYPPRIFANLFISKSRDFQGTQLIGKPECDVLLAHATVHLARFYAIVILSVFTCTADASIYLA